MITPLNVLVGYALFNCSIDDHGEDGSITVTKAFYLTI